MGNAPNRYAVVNNDGLVVNVIIWKGDPYAFKPNTRLVHSHDAQVGDSIDVKTGVLTRKSGRDLPK